LVRINRACESGEILHNQVIREAMDAAKSGGRAFHFLGLVSPGGVHSSTDHLLCLLRMAKSRGLSRVFIHAFLDGRDTPPRGALANIGAMERALQEIGVGQIAAVSGGYYAMARDRRWDRVKLAFDAIVRGQGPAAASAAAAIRASYEAKVTDEFVRPTVIVKG